MCTLNKTTIGIHNKATIKKVFTIVILDFMTFGSSISLPTEKENTMDSAKTTKSCSSTCKAENKSNKLACKLTKPELQERKRTILKGLKTQIVDKRELENGYSFKFPGTDEILDELTEFIKTERACCDFFVFGLSTRGNKSETWLELTGPEGAKDFIQTELEL